MTRTCLPVVAHAVEHSSGDDLAAEDVARKGEIPRDGRVRVVVVVVPAEVDEIAAARPLTPGRAHGALTPARELPDSADPEGTLLAPLRRATRTPERGQVR